LHIGKQEGTRTLLTDGQRTSRAPNDTSAMASRCWGQGVLATWSCPIFQHRENNTQTSRVSMQKCGGVTHRPRASLQAGCISPRLLTSLLLLASYLGVCVCVYVCVCMLVSVYMCVCVGKAFHSPVVCVPTIFLLLFFLESLRHLRRQSESLIHSASGIDKLPLSRVNEVPSNFRGKKFSIPLHI